MTTYTIETPQFHGCQEKFHLHKQTGTFNKTDLKFYPFKNMFGNYSGGDHEVQFKNINDFMKSVVTEWSDCPVEGCNNKICLSLESDKCFVHTKGWRYWKLFKIWLRNKIIKLKWK